MKLKVIFTCALLASTLTGCATVVNGTHEVVEVKTPPTTKAACTLTNDRGQWQIGSTPGKVQVHKSRAAINVKCSKVGYQTKETFISSHMQGAIAGNILIGGIIGAGIDAEDGSAYAYPKTIIVPLKKK